MTSMSPIFSVYDPFLQRPKKHLRVGSGCMLVCHPRKAGPGLQFLSEVWRAQMYYAVADQGTHHANSVIDDDDYDLSMTFKYFTCFVFQTGPPATVGLQPETIEAITNKST